MGHASSSFDWIWPVLPGFGRNWSESVRSSLMRFANLLTVQAGGASSGSRRARTGNGGGQELRF